MSVHYGDCLDVMAAMPDHSIDLIVTSPPYADRRQTQYGGINPDEYVAWFIPRAEQMRRLLKPTGSLVVNIKEGTRDGERLTYTLDLVLAMRAAGWRWIDEYCWHKTAAMPGRWRHRFRDQWERIHHFAVTCDLKWRPDAVMVPTNPRMVERAKRLTRQGRTNRHVNANSGFSVDQSKWDRPMSYPSNVLHASPVTTNEGHSAAYPEWLPEFFVRLLTDEGDTVLDPFLGSGTTYRVAKRLGRQAVGIELHTSTTMRLTERHGTEAML